MGRSRLVRLGIAVLAGLLATGALSAPAATAAAGGTIRGAFTSSTGAPIANVFVVAWSADHEWRGAGFTDDNGQYELTEVEAGGIRLEFDNQGRRQWSPGVLTEEDATLYTLAEGGTLTVDERQLPGGRIEGRFVDASGAPAQAEVTVSGVGEQTWLYAYTDAEGAWSVEAAAGTYKVSYRWDGSKQWAVQQRDESDATTVTVTTGETTTIDDSKLPTGTAGGRLTTAAGAPLSGASVNLYRGDEPLSYAGTDEDGRYSFGEVLPGDDYRVSFSVDGGSEQWVPGTADREQARRFTVVAGEHTTIDDRQLGVASVSGRLTGVDGSPLAGFEVMLDRNGDPRYATTGDDGRYTFSEVLPGDYRVAFISPDWRREQWAYGKGSASEATVIAVGSGEAVTVNDTWLPGATLVVDAVDEATGAPVQNFCVWVFAPRDGSGCSDGSRVTVENLPGGEFPVSVSPGEGSYYLRAADVPAKLVAGETTTLTVRLKQGGRVEIAATSRATGAAVADTCAILKVIGEGYLGDGYGDCTDGSGKAITAAVDAGTYELFAVAPAGYGHQWVARTGGTGDQRAAARIVVKPGRTVKAPKVLLDPPGTITGVVTDAAGKALAGADVAYSAWGDAGPNWNTRTDAQGRYTLGKLGPYGWPLLFSAAGHPREWSGHEGNRFKADQVRVVAGGSTTYNFAMAAKTAKLQGKVTVPAHPQAGWRLYARNAVTGDQMGGFDHSGAGAGGTYTIPLIGAQPVKIDWVTWGDGIEWNEGSYDNGARVTIPATGTRKLDLVLD